MESSLKSKIVKCNLCKRDSKSVRGLSCKSKSLGVVSEFDNILNTIENYIFDSETST